MPTCCPNPCWMDDLKDTCSEMSEQMHANMCCFKQRMHSSFAQMSAHFQCPCQKCAHARHQQCPCEPGYGVMGQGAMGMSSSQPPAFFPASPQSSTNQTFPAPEQSIHQYPPAAITPQEPTSMPSVPAPPSSTPSTSPPPSDSAPVVVPKINSSASNQPPSIIPPVDPSIPLELHSNLNQVGFRKADAQRTANNGWKPVETLPNTLR